MKVTLEEISQIKIELNKILEELRRIKAKHQKDRTDGTSNPPEEGLR